MTNCLTESQIEHWVLMKLLEPETHLPDHLATCTFCEGIAEDLHEFYTQTAVEFEKINPESLVALIKEKQSRKNSNIYRFDHVHLVQSLPVKPSYTRTLAADGGAPTAVPEVKNVGVFASTDGRLMVRILKSQKGDTSLFLLSDSPELYQNVLVRIVGTEQEYVTDMTGCIHLGHIDLPPTENLGIEVQTTLDTYDLKTLFPRTGELLGEGEILVKSSDDRKLKLEILSVDGKYNLKISVVESQARGGMSNVKIMVVRHEGPTEVKTFDKGVALFQEIQDPENLQVKIFA